MVFALLLSHRSPPCGNIAFYVGLSKLHGGMPSNFGGMYIILHLHKPNIHNFSVSGTIEVPGLGRLKPFTLGGPHLKAATNSPKSGLFILRRTSSCSGVNRTELRCSSSLPGPISGSSWSSREFGSSSLIDSDEATRSSTSSSDLFLGACFRFFLGAIPMSQGWVEHRMLWYHVTHSQVSGWTHLRVQLCVVAEKWDLRGAPDFQH